MKQSPKITYFLSNYNGYNSTEMELGKQYMDKLLLIIIHLTKFMILHYPR